MVDIKTINAEGTTLRQHQMKMLGMLEYIDDLCRKNHIQYWLSGGTLLGAIRHRGFIPWDDDLDIIFLKKDLRKIHQILSKKQSDLYVLQSHQTDVYYVAPYEKLRLRKTRIYESNHNDYQYRYQGIYIDLFYLEPAICSLQQVSDKFQTLLIKLTQCKSNLCGLKLLLVSIVAFGLKNFLYPVFSYLSSIIDRNRVSYPLGSYFHTQFDRSWFDTTIEVEFEGRYFFAPKNYDAVLRAQYGDYMQLPPLESIRNHVYLINFKY